MATATLEQPEVSAPAERTEMVEVDLGKLFAILTAHWKSDMHVKVSSDPSAVMKNPAYQMTIDLGKKVLPLIFKEYEKEDDMWAIAIACILDFSPIPEEHYGRIALIREDWLKWGRANGYL
jgi:hypothetical protein